ncbi:MAG: DUF6259 domain-containing protein [Armatimonadota bacterium]
MASYTLKNDHLRLTLSADGAVQELTNLVTGTNHIVRPGMDLWRIILQDEESLVNLVTPGNQPMEVCREGEGLVLTVPRLAYSTHDGLRTVEVTLRLSVTLDGDAARWVAEVENRDPAIRVMEVWAPMINGMRPPADWALYYPQDCGMRLVDPVRNLGDRGKMFRFGVSNAHQRELYPGKASMQWMGLYGEEEGLYVCSEDDSLQTTCLNAERNFGATPEEDSLLLCFIKYPGQRLGTWTSAPVVTAPHPGDWHAGARRYRAWADWWMSPATPPDWVQRMPGLQDTILREQYGKLVYSYDDIPMLHEAANEVGIDLVKISGWHPAGHDNAFPDWQVDPAQGGREKLQQMIAQARGAGGKMMFYLQAVQMSSNSTFYAEYGPQVSMRDPYGDELADIFTWPGPSTFLPLSAQHRLINACLSMKEWQEIIKYRTRYLLDLGVDCVYLDRLAGYPGYLCFNENHAHERPCDAYADRVKLGQECRAMVKAKNPEIALASEYINDAGLQPFDFTIPFGFGVHHGGNNFGELFRYTFPEYIITTQYLNGPEYERLRFALVMGFRFFFAINWQHDPISNTPPEFRAYVKSLVDLWTAHADPFLLGKFVDTEGMRNNNPALFAKAYRGETSFGVAVWNPTDEEQPLHITTEDGRSLRWAGPDGVIDGVLPAQGVALGKV